jgi:hypothetical protein
MCRTRSIPTIARKQTQMPSKAHLFYRRRMPSRFTEAINLGTPRMHLKILWGDAVWAMGGPVRSSVEAAVAETT